MGDSSSIKNKVLVIAEDVALTEDRIYNFDTYQYKNVGIQIVWKNLTGTIDAEVDFKVSVDKIHFDEISSSVSLSGASGNDCIPLESIYFPIIQVKVNKNLVTGGTISLYVCFKD